jgi:hypothetical protein
MTPLLEDSTGHAVMIVKAMTPGPQNSHARSRQIVALFLITAAFLLLSPAMMAMAQKRKKPTSASKPAVNELTKLRDEFIRLTKEYKSSLEKLALTYEREVQQAQTRVTQAKQLFEEGLISKHQLDESESALTLATEMVNKTRGEITSADLQIANTLVEAQAEAQIAKAALRKGALVNTSSYIRYAGAGNWLLPEAWKVQQFFQSTFNRPLPIAVFGQGPIHDRWRLDHRNAMDISLHPDGLEGQALIAFLRKNGIPFLAFRSAIPGTATGPHIHVGRPSHRY